jgi:hypothetical protein
LKLNHASLRDFIDICLKGRYCARLNRTISRACPANRIGPHYQSQTGQLDLEVTMWFPSSREISRSESYSRLSRTTRACTDRSHSRGDCPSRTPLL